MTRRVFFSFHFDRDAWRVGQVRNHAITSGIETFRQGEWESVRRYDDTTIKAWIDKELNNTSVTVVLIGAETYKRPYIKYELRKSWEKEKGILGIRIHNLMNQYRQTDEFGSVDFGLSFLDKNGLGKQFF
jgi:hypothetical protein